MIAGLSALPLVLRRPAVFKLFNQLKRMDRFMHGLRFLSNRANLVFDRFLADLGALDQTDQVIAKIVGLVENPPLPALPPPFVGLFQRIDGVAEIKNLAKTWQNCLADYLHSINEGTATVYHLNSGGLPAVAFVLRLASQSGQRAKKCRY